MKAALEGVRGVLKAEVNLATKVATVEYVPGTLTEAELLTAVEHVDTRLRLRHWAHGLLRRLRRGTGDQ